MSKQQELESSLLSTAFSSPLSSPPDSLDGFDSFESYEGRRRIPPSPTSKRNTGERPIVVEKLEALEKRKKTKELDLSAGIEPLNAFSNPTPARELHQVPTIPEQPKAIKEDKIDEVGPGGSESRHAASSPTPAREPGVQGHIILEQHGPIKKEDKTDELDASDAPETTSPSPPSEIESGQMPTMLEQLEALEREEMTQEPIRAEATRPTTGQDPSDEVHDTIIYGTAAPKSPSSLGDDEKPCTHLENEKRSPAKRKASGQGRKQPANKNARRSAPAPRKTAKQKKWDPPFVFTDTKSPLTEADLRVCIPPAFTALAANLPDQAILLLPRAWDILTANEKRSVLAKFPDDGHILDAGTDDARPDIQSLRNNDNFRHDCARYSENISEGRHDEEWLQQAWVAHEKHRRGDFDDFLEQKFVEDWGVEIPEGHLTQRARQSIDSMTSGSRRVSTAASIVSRGSVSRAGSPTAAATPENVRILRQLTLENSPLPSALPSETGSPGDVTPNVGTSMEGVILSPGREA